MANKTKKRKRSKKSEKSEKSEKSLKREKFKKMSCSPLSETKSSIHENTCYTSEGLVKIIELWNVRHPDNKFTSNNPHEIWNFMKTQMENVCDNEMCWIRQKFAENDNKKLLEHFAPKAPSTWEKKPYEWLSSVDITKVMKQYEKAYPNFSFIGPSPIDFDKRLHYDNCVWEELCKFDLNKFIKKNVNKIGICFNTDPHDKGGSHWISLFIDITKQYMFYFDSNGIKAPKQIKVLVDRIKEQGKQLNIEFEYSDNSKLTHQKLDGQCGVYVLYVIVELLKEAKTPEYFQTTRVDDKLMKDYRWIYYNI